MIDSIRVRCNECGHIKVLNQSEVVEVDLIIAQGANKNELSAVNKNLRCSNCGSKHSSISINSEVSTNIFEVKSSDRKNLSKCSYDGLIYKTGSICPNYAAHKDIKKHRGKGKANDFYENRRSY